MKELKQVIDFIIEIDKLKDVTRKVKPLSNKRYENSAEHSWQITMFALSMAKHVPDVDINRVIKMLLIHDIGEIDTGDTFFFTEGGWEERKADELKAVKRICGILPEETEKEFIELWKEFEDGKTRDSEFANALDRVMPVILNLNNNGQSWREHDMPYEKVVNKIKPPIKRGFPELWEVVEPMLENALEKGFFKHKV